VQKLRVADSVGVVGDARDLQMPGPAADHLPVAGVFDMPAGEADLDIGHALDAR
jgi:hypothetical protein